MSSAVIRHLSRRIIPENVSIRSHLLHIASGLSDVIALGRGDPDFDPAPHIVEAARRAIAGSAAHHYTAPAGMAALREAIAAALKADFGLDYGADEVIVTAGVQESIMLCMLGLVDTGDEVLITSPRFTTYDTAVAMCGGVPVPVPTHEADDFALMPREIAARITARTKALVLVSPNNPTGAVTPPATIAEIADLCRRHDLVVISDEIYAKLIYDGAEHLSIGRLDGMKDRTITLNGFSKSHAMTGWRIGYLAGPRDFIRSVTEPRHTLSINTSTPSQFAALAALTGPQDAVQAMLASYAGRRAFLMPALRELGFTYGFPGGGFYIYTNVSSTGLPVAQFCERLLTEGRVLLFPGSLFGDTGGRHVRISFLQPLDRLEQAVERIASVFRT